MNSNSGLVFESSFCICIAIFCSALTSMSCIPGAIVAFAVAWVTNVKAARKHAIVAPVMSIGFGALAGALLCFNGSHPIAALVAVIFSICGWASSSFCRLQGNRYRRGDQRPTPTLLRRIRVLLASLAILIACPAVAAIFSFVGDLTAKNPIDRGADLGAYLVIGTFVGVILSAPYLILAITFEK